jgi:regulator of cell morphogenesis and NO signaling
MTASTQTVREIALEDPRSIRVFEEFGIDYCCGGRKPLAEACAGKNVAVDAVIAALERAVQGKSRETDDWNTQPLATLTRHIVETYHAIINREIPRITQLAGKVVNRHGESKPELGAIQAKFAQLSAELTQHCGKEEVVLFPYIAKLEGAIATEAARPQGCFGSVTNPIAMMTLEHDAAGALIEEIRQLSDGFRPPAGACPTFPAFYNGLYEFEQDLHRHTSKTTFCSDARWRGKQPDCDPPAGRCLLSRLVSNHG